MVNYTFYQGLYFMEKNKNITLTLNNIGMIKNASLDISGLSVIAGKNDQGKSTVGKALMALIKADNMGKGRPTESKKYFNRLISLLFDNKISTQGRISVEKTNEESYVVEINEHKCEKFSNGECVFWDCTFIQTPIIWDLCDFFYFIERMQKEDELFQEKFDMKYPYSMWDLYGKLSLKRDHKVSQAIKDIAEEDIMNIIHGTFVQDRVSFMFYKIIESKLYEIPVINTAVGIKSFGILQTLIRNTYVNPYGFFVFDEPENHLHPVWQVKFAEILTRLVQNHVCIMVNTHSPYMLEALHKYGKKYDINANFYLADGGKVEQIDDDNSATLEKIYKKLNQSFISLDEILDEVED